jgi:hypothetical protein
MKYSSVYVDDVINEDRLFFFEIPRLGSFFAIKFKLQTYFSNECFVKILEHLKKNFIPELGRRGI